MKNFENIIGYESVKKELIQISDVLKNREYYEKLGVRTPRGLLLYGKPGVGKTLMAKAVIEASGRKAFVCRKDKSNGEFVDEIKRTFDAAAEAAPSIVFLDDMDKFANGDEGHPDAEEYVTVQSCIDEVKDKEVFVIATANSIRALPESLMRAGRFDRTIKISAPHGTSAAKIIEYYLKNKNCAVSLDPVEISKLMDGKSCAELETVVNEAGIFAGYERSDFITMTHFLKAYLRIIHRMSIDTLLNGELNAPLLDGRDLMTNIIYHEAGHATVHEVLMPGSVTLITAYSAVGDSGGFTKYYNDDEKIVKDFRINVIGGLGGCAATDHKFGLRDLGSSGDFDEVFTEVKNYMTDNCYLGFSLHSCNWHDSEAIKYDQEKAVAREVERYYLKAKEIISANNELFERMAHALAKKGVLTSADIGEIKKDCRIVPVGI